MLELSGCARLFFYPERGHVLTPDQLHLNYQDVFFKAPDGLQLHGWYIAAPDKAIGTILFLHGNAQNISTHINSVYWLAERGFNLFLLDYRGYGTSEGKATLAGIHNDAEGALQYLAEKNNADLNALVVLGQSLGGAVAITTVAQTRYRNRIKALVVEGAFSSYPQIAQEKLADVWLMWPFQLLPFLTISGVYDPINVIQNISPIPILFIHGEADPIIPPAHTYRLYQAARRPKELWIVPRGGHIEAFTKTTYRDRLVSYLIRVLK